MDYNTDFSLELLKKYNKEYFHIQHGITVDEVMRYFASKYGEEEDFWGNVGLLHDLDFEQFPEEHCTMTSKILKEEGYSDKFIHGVKSHGYNMVSDVKPDHLMEKILFAVDELTGLIGAAALMRPSKSFQDMELKSVKKKFKDKKFAAGCSREVISNGAEYLGWSLEELLQETLDALKSQESNINHRLKEAFAI
ncbi:MAG: hydrolase [Gallicola sp.]|nr:hydrolase [Gallicola sp.]